MNPREKRSDQAALATRQLKSFQMLFMHPWMYRKRSSSMDKKCVASSSYQRCECRKFVLGERIHNPMLTIQDRRSRAAVVLDVISAPRGLEHIVVIQITTGCGVRANKICRFRILCK